VLAGELGDTHSEQTQSRIPAADCQETLGRGIFEADSLGQFLNGKLMHV